MSSALRFQGCPFPARGRPGFSLSSRTLEPHPGQPTPPALEVKDLRFAYAGGPPILPGISHVFAPGKLTAIVGPNGAGKSTLLRLLAGLLIPDGGDVLAGGTSVRTMSAAARASRLVYIPQRSSVAFAFTVRQVVAMGRLAAGEGPSSPAVARAIEQAELAYVADAPVGHLSVGQQQRVTLARALAQVDRGDGQFGATALLADEPVSAMDPAHAVRTMAVLRALVERGLSVVVVLHDLGLVLRTADEVLLFDASGQIVGAGPVGSTLTAATAASVFQTPFDALVDPAGRVAGLAPKATS